MSDSVAQSRPFNLLVFSCLSIISHGPKRLTFCFQVLWATELRVEPCVARQTLPGLGYFGKEGSEIQLQWKTTTIWYSGSPST